MEYYYTFLKQLSGIICKTNRRINTFYLLQFVEKPPVKKAEGFCLLVVDKV